jgi:DNA-binding XRE family transcriptional regulator
MEGVYMWSRKHDRCVLCGKAELRHVARGLCTSCYSKDIQEKHHGTNLERRKGRACRSGEPDAEKLREYYWEKGMSMSDIARKFHVTRQAIHLLMKKYDIPKRSLAKAREMALEQGKVTWAKADIKGDSRQVKPVKRYVNEAFFDAWTPEMAWVLGLMITDGNVCLMNNTGAGIKSRKSKVISFGQKDSELPEKILGLMGSNAKIIYRPEKTYNGIKSGSLYQFQIYNTRLFDRLVELGVTERKSLTVKFPEVPSNCMRHFIRGCWDGDGSVSDTHKGKGAMKARFFSGSRCFIESMMENLILAGLPARKIHSDRSGRYHHLNYNSKQAAQLYHYLYSAVGETMRLERKYRRFRKIHEVLRE